MEDKKLRDFLPDKNSSYKREFSNSNKLSKIKELNWSEVLPFLTVLDSNKNSETFISVFLFKIKNWLGKKQVYKSFYDFYYLI